MSIFRSKWFMGAMVLLVAWLTLSFIKIKLHKNIVNKEVVELEEKIKGFESNNSFLERFIGYMTNPSYLEKEARLKLNYKAPGEEVVFIYPDENGANASSASADFNKQLAQMPNYLKWVYYLFGY